MADSREMLHKTPMRIGVAADHGGFELKVYLVRMLSDAGYEVADFGDPQHNPDDDYPDFVGAPGQGGGGWRGRPGLGHLRQRRWCMRCRQQGAGRARVPDP